MTIKTADIPQLLHRHFPRIAEKKLQEAIAEVGQVMSFRAGEIIMDYDSYIRLVPLIISGSIKVTKEDDLDGREILLYFLTAGDTCSMSFSCCMMNKRSVIRTEAVEDTEMIAIPIKYVDQWMTQFQSWKNFVMSSYDQRLEDLVRVIDSIAFSNMDTRLQAYLEARCESTSSSTIQATHQEIANDLNASREAISRMLKKLEKLGKVELGRNLIRVL
ncbi:MAG: Crp/Fnr family transcriptional regulator [Bacteroidota bacterium]